MSRNTGTTTTNAGDPTGELEVAATEVTETERRVSEYGEETVEEVADAYEQAIKLLDSYEGRATGTGDFEAYLEFQGQFADLVESLADDLPEREAFEAAEERIDKRRLSERDFERARTDLEGAADIAALLDERREARAQYREARRDVTTDLVETRERIESHENLLELGDADLQAPTENLREPIESYDEAVSTAFSTFKKDASAREVLDFVEATEEYPLVEFRQPPEALVSYVESREAGTKPIPELVEFSRYSNSKLDHYVEDPAALKRAVATNETYLERLDSHPLEVEWPPREGAELRWRADELIAVVAKFAPEDVVAKLREVRDLTRDEAEFGRLRTAARAEAELASEEREKLANGQVERELEQLRERKEQLESALEEYPERSQ
ncbi:DUF7118 family protein [Halorussus halophilus]|uniref:DUF7118 family protein n=1 Tax=Halorussus halophilus TaxID=2650975 RepID=UPI001300D257|nr:hypothetical protein [Halorussus halophilus]